MTLVKFRRHLYTREEALATTWTTRKNTFYAVANSVEGASPKYILGDGVSSLAQLVTADEFLGEDGAASGNYTEYLATITQSGTDAPTATVLVNTLGGTPVLSRFGIGQYFLTLSGAFAGNVAILQFGPENGAQGFFAEKSGDNALAFYSYSDEDAGTAADGQLAAATLWVRVYAA